MKPERWQQIDELLQSALDHVPEQRAAFLADACRGDESLRCEVESLLRHHEQANSFLERSPGDIAAEMLTRGQFRLPEGQLIGRYRILSLLGVGGMGEVYLAEDASLRRQVALKLLPARFTEDADRVRRFEQEARAASALNHPNIITIHEIGQHEQIHFIVTEFINGQTLRQAITAAPMKLSEALDVAIQVASALDAAHTTGIVHRDIKPENIMIRSDGLVRVLDFGLAKLVERPGAEPDSEGGPVIGTARYMSPEQARGRGVDARTDIFSLGVVLYEMVAGRAPFGGNSTRDVLTAILEKEPPPFGELTPGMPAEVEPLVKRALAKERKERYQSAKDLQIDLKRIKEDSELQTKLAGLSPLRLQEERIRLRKRRFLIGSVSVSIAITAIVAFYFSPLSLSTSNIPTPRQITYQSGNTSGARIAPDGQTIVYGLMEKGPIKLYVGNLNSEKSEPFSIPGTGNVGNFGIQSISWDNKVAILLNCRLNWGECRGGTLAWVPLAGGKEPKGVADEDVYAEEADWDPSGKDMAIIRVVDNKYQLEYPIGTVLYVAPGWIEYMRFSPNGDRIAFINHPILGEITGSVDVVDYPSGKHKTLSVMWNSAKGLAWSPSGDAVWFTAGADRKLHLRTASTSGVGRLVYTPLTDMMVQDVSPDGRVLVSDTNPRAHMFGGDTKSQIERNISFKDWSTAADISTDGTRVLFYEWGPQVKGAHSVYLLNLKNLDEEPRLLGPGRALALSPEGDSALAVQVTLPPDGIPVSQLVLLPTVPGKSQNLPGATFREIPFASWFPRSKRILFTALDKDHDSLRSYTQNLDGGFPQLFERGRVAFLVSPDEKRIVGTDAFGDLCIYSLPGDGSECEPIRGVEDGDIPIQWADDGYSLYVRGEGDLTANVFKIRLSDGHRETLIKISPNQVVNIGLQEKILITPDGKSYVYTYWTALSKMSEILGLK